jgi:hypothetical protein
MASSSQQFIAEIEPQRDSLYSRALSLAASPAAAESTLIAAVCRAWGAVIANDQKQPVAAIAALLPATGEIAPAAMPADVWARVTAAIQLEASRTGGASSLAEGHILLKPDPLLAPKKIKRTAVRAGMAPMYRFILAAAIVVVLAVSLTVYIMRR